MLFFADHSRVISLRDTARQVAGSLAAIAERYRNNPAPPYLAALETHAELVATVIALGEAHQALADRLCPTADDIVLETEEMITAELLLGRCLFRSVKILQIGSGDNYTRHLPELLDTAAKAASRTAKLEGIDPLLAKVTEGYAFYSLFPEMYLESLSSALAGGPKCSSYIAIGIRSIGTSLASIVASALIEMGYAASVVTMRPRGHPFDRYIELSPRLKARLREASCTGSGFIVVDEGPGLSCSSFLSVCAALEEMGIDRERITLLSAWQGKPGSFASDELRDRWNRARVFHTPANKAFDGWRALVPFVRHPAARSLGSDGRPAPSEVEIVDLSYGRWRERCYPAPARWPAVHQAMERTKLLVHLPCMRSDSRTPRPSPTAVGEGADCLLAKFAGLGHYGREKLDRAKILADAGFGPPAIGLAYGFLLHPFLGDFRPMSAQELTPEVMVRLVDYYAFILRHFSKPPMDRFDSLIETIEVNAGKGLGLDLSSFIRRWRPYQGAIDRLSLVLLDGKPQPYEWLTGAIRGRTTLIKTDNADHFLDHSLVGEQSILWDLAGACEEWEMDGARVSLFMSLWEGKTGDRQATSLLDFFRTAYLALRVAAVHYAIHGASEEDTRTSLQLQQAKYSGRLRKLITTGSRERKADG